MTSPRKPRFRFGPALPTRPWERDARSRSYRPRHRRGPWSSRVQSVPAIRERHGREA